SLKMYPPFGPVVLVHETGAAIRDQQSIRLKSYTSCNEPQVEPETARVQQTKQYFALHRPPRQRKRPVPIASSQDETQCPVAENEALPLGGRLHTAWEEVREWQERTPASAVGNRLRPCGPVSRFPD